MTGSNEKKIIIIRKHEKKIFFGADLEMGYCPLIIRQARAARRWARRGVAGHTGHAAGVRRLWAGRRQAAGPDGWTGRAEGGRAAGGNAGRAARAHARPGRAAGLADRALGALSLF